MTMTAGYILALFLKILCSKSLTADFIFKNYYVYSSFAKGCHGYYICNPDNKRLDEWVSVDRMDFDHVQLPKKEVKVASLRSSRPVSPDVTTYDSGSSTPPWPTCNLKRHLSGAAATAAVNKKRKLEQAVMAAAAATNNNSPSTSAVTVTTPTSTNAIMVIILATIVTVVTIVTVPLY